MKFKKPFILTIVVVLILSISAGFIYNKNVQASELKTSLENYIKNDEYREALNVINKANRDKIISTAFGFNNAAKDILTKHIDNLEKDYLEDKINISKLNSYLEEIMSFNILDENEIKSVKDEMSKEEVIKSSYRNSKELYNNKEYKNALKILEGIPEGSRENLEIEELKDSINKDYKEFSDKTLDGLIKDEKYKEGLNFLNEVKDVYTETDWKEKVDNINKLIDKKNEEIKKKKAEQEVRKKAEEAKKREEERKVEAARAASNNNTLASEKSYTSYRIIVSLNEQLTKIFKGSEENWELIKSINSSTGLPGAETPKGTFRISSRGNWFFSQKYQEGAKYWTSFYGNYLFHSFPMDRNKNILDYTLGKPASHGCVRMTVEDAKWIHDNIPNGTKVIVQ